jgi:hypothetical protein
MSVERLRLIETREVSTPLSIISSCPSLRGIVVSKSLQERHLHSQNISYIVEPVRPAFRSHYHIALVSPAQSAQMVAVVVVLTRAGSCFEITYQASVIAVRMRSIPHILRWATYEGHLESMQESSNKY